MSLPRPRSILSESVPIAGIMLFWLVASWLGSYPLVATGARFAGIVMALTYAVVRGVALAETTGPSLAFDTPESVLHANGLVLLAAAGWFVVARLVVFVEQLWEELALPGAFTSPADGFVFAFTATGVVTVVMYAVAIGNAALHGGSQPGNGSQPVSNESPADD